MQDLLPDMIYYSENEVGREEWYSGEGVNTAESNNIRQISKAWNCSIKLDPKHELELKEYE